MTNLEQSIYDICAAHDLLAISFQLHPAHQSFTCYAHAKIDDTDDGRLCASGHGEKLNTAVANAIAAMAAKRGAVAPTLADEPLAA